MSPGAGQGIARGQGTRVPLQMPMPASQPTGNDLEAGIRWVQEHHTPSRTRQGMLAGCPIGTVLAAGTGTPMDGLVVRERVRGWSCGLQATKDSEGHMGLRW